MASSRISSSKYFNRLEVNKLEVNNLKVNEEKQTNPEWLFSLIGEATYNADTNTLTLINTDNKDKLKLLGFTDRPNRQQIEFDGVNTQFGPLQTLDLLFNADNNIDSFSEDPPNAVLVMNNKQVVYELVKFDTNTFHLKPLPNHSEYYNHSEDYTGEISLFIDNWWKKLKSGVKSDVNAIVSSVKSDVNAIVSEVYKEISNGNKISKGSEWYNTIKGYYNDHKTPPQIAKDIENAGKDILTTAKLLAGLTLYIDTKFFITIGLKEEAMETFTEALKLVLPSAQ